MISQGFLGNLVRFSNNPPSCVQAYYTPIEACSGRCTGPATHARAFELLNLEAKCIQPAPTSTADKSNMILAVLGARGAGSGCARYSSGLRIRHLGRSKECK